MSDLLDRYEVALRLAADRHYRYGRVSRLSALAGRRTWLAVVLRAVRTPGPPRPRPRLRRGRTAGRPRAR